MNKKACVNILALTLAFAWCGCHRTVSFTNPPQVLEGDVVSLVPYLGRWNPMPVPGFDDWEAGDDVDPATVVHYVEITGHPDECSVLFCSETTMWPGGQKERSYGPIRLIRVSDKILAFEEVDVGPRDPPSYHVFWVAFLDEERTRMELRPLRIQFVHERILAGALEGRSNDTFRIRLVHVTADSTRVRQFLEENIDDPAMFYYTEGSPAIVLERIPAQ